MGKAEQQIFGLKGYGKPANKTLFILVLGLQLLNDLKEFKPIFGIFSRRYIKQLE